MRYKAREHQNTIDKDSIWVGITTSLYSGDYDQTQSKFFEIWLNGNKGNLSIGNDGDFCIVDLYKPWIVKKDKMASKSKNTCIEDKKLQGIVTNTFVKGEELFKLQ